MAVWINEFHYDNTGTDVGEFIEVAGAAGTNLSGYSLVLYNGNPTLRNVYATIPLTGTIDNEQNGFGALSFTATGLQNGGFPATTTEPDGIALVNGTTVVQFLSYEGSGASATFVAANGPATGQTSVNVGVAEAGTEPVGGSLRLTGTGDEYADFAWGTTTDDSPGSINPGQSFGGPPPGETVSIDDVSVAEGDGGQTAVTFTVTRSGNAGAFTIDFETQDGTATVADGDFDAAVGQLTFAAGGALTETITVQVNGDMAVEPDQGFVVRLRNLIDVSGTTTIADDSGAGTIVNDDVTLTAIYDIQGAGHKSAFVGGAVGEFGNSGAVRVTTEGVVTGLTTNGFWIQDAAGDGDVATSDGIFVFTSSAPAASIAVGDLLRVTGQVSEFRPGGSGGGDNLTITQLVASASTSGASIQEIGTGTVAATVLGVDRIPPFNAIEDDGFTSFDPATDGIDFFESLEGMLVELPTPTAISPTSEFRTQNFSDPLNPEGPPQEEIWVRVPNGFDADSLTPNGGLIIAEGDFNPERIQIDDLTAALDLPDVKVGDVLSTVTGIVSYDFQNYEVLTGVAPTVTDGGLTRETTTIARDARQVTVGTYNVENLDPEVENTSTWGMGGVGANGEGGVTGSSSGNSSGTLYGRLGNSDDDIGSGKYAAHAAQIALNMGAPTIVALQEVQDNDGAEISGVVDSAETLQVLVDLIFANHGIAYSFAYENPPGVNQDGGQPNANIRPAFLYRADQVELIGTERLTDPNPGEADLFAGDDFASSRKPLVGTFALNGVEFTVINNHLNSKGGDDALYGNVQPPVFSSELQRTEQARILNGFVDGLLAADADARVLVVGDLNDFEFSTPVETLTGEAEGEQVLTDLAEALLPPNERYGYSFQGNAQALDHQLASDSLLALGNAAFDIVHVNSEFSDQASDHDPSVSRFDFRAFAERLRGTTGDELIEGFGGKDRLTGRQGADTLSGGADNDKLSGGKGEDVFVFAPGGGTDRVMDFRDGQDRLDLTAFGGVDGVEDLDISSDAVMTRIRVDGVTIRLLGVAEDVIDAGDFLFA